MHMQAGVNQDGLIVAIGEAMVEFNQIGPPSQRMYLQGIGGDTSNFVIAAARQGARTAYISAVGDDRCGEQLRAQWRQDGVDASAVLCKPDAPTGLYFVTHTERGHEFSFMRRASAASRFCADDLPASMIARAAVLHLSAVTLAISDSMQASAWTAIDIARDGGALVSFDTNLRLSLWPLERARDAILRAIASSDICLPSYDDLAAVTGLVQPDSMLDYCLGLGARLVALKLGAHGALVGTQSERHRIAPFPCQPVDATGAGDAFGGAFVARWVAGYDPLSAARYAAAVGAISTEAHGAVDPIPHRERVLAALGQHPLGATQAAAG